MKRRNRKYQDLVGQRFGFLVAVAKVPRERGCYWKCKCDCGGMKAVQASNLRSGNIKSCGCKWRGATTTHGRSGTTEWLAWRNMHVRCENPKASGYARYGGRGIRVCLRWRRFEPFFKDMGLKPTPRHTMERQDRNKGYTPKNCCWATNAEQQKNTSRNRLVVWRGRRMIMADAIRLSGLPPKLVETRMRRDGWSLKKALTTPPQHN